MRTGGGGGLSAADIDDELAQSAGRLTILFGRHSGSATLDVLSKDVRRGLKLFAGLLRTPAFDPESVDLAKQQAIERIRRREDEPESIASREFVKLLYGASHPTALESSIESVAGSSRDDLIAFHRHSVHPNGMVLGVSGDFKTDEMVAMLREVFGDWEQGTVPKVTIADVPEDEAERAELLSKAARMLPNATPEQRAALRTSALAFLREDVREHIAMDEELLFPRLTERLGDPLATAPMRYEHRAMRWWTEQIASADLADVDELQRLLYGVHALIRVHLSREEDLHVAALESPQWPAC